MDDILDSDRHLRLMKSMLLPGSCRVLIAGDGKHAREIVSREQINLIVPYIMMTKRMDMTWQPA